jgi:hypothetical protein
MRDIWYLFFQIFIDTKNVNLTERQSLSKNVPNVCTTVIRESTSQDTTDSQVNDNLISMKSY